MTTKKSPKKISIKKSTRVSIKYVLVDGDGIYFYKLTKGGYKGCRGAGGAKPFQTESDALEYKKNYEDRLAGMVTESVPASLFRR